MTNSAQRPGGGVAGDDGDVGLLWLGGCRGVGAKAGRALLVNQVGHHTLAVLHLLSILLVIYHPDVLGHVFELIGQSLTLYFRQDPTLVVIPTHTNTHTHTHTHSCVII